jgi:hypothetical protein
MDTVSFKSRRAKPQQGEASQTVAPAAQSRVDTVALAGIWQAVLRCQTAALEDNFFELGGTSLHAMLMASRVDKLLASELSLVQFFENPTFAGLCASVVPSEPNEP